MSHKVITLEIIAFDEHEAEGINEAIGSILEREDWRVFCWSSEEASTEHIAWLVGEELVREPEHRMAARGRPDYDPRIDYPERYREGPI